MRLLDRFIHDVLKRPYQLYCAIDQGSGKTVVLLHGIASSSNVWQRLIGLLPQDACRVLAFDLLGFGKSPKPDWLQYNVDDHAKAVIASIEKRRVKGTIILVGHSMGCLVAVHIAKLRPDLVKHLVLFEMPLYEGLPNTRVYNRRKDFYYLIYNRVISTPEIAVMGSKVLKNAVTKISGFEISPTTWLPFIRSLENTIIKQRTLEDMRQLKVPADVIYGTLDMLVIRGDPKKIFGNEFTNLNTHTIAEIHAVSRKASIFLSNQILELLNAPKAERRKARTKIVHTVRKLKPTRSKAKNAP